MRFFNDTATTEIYTLSLHDALPSYEIPFFERGCVTKICDSASNLSSKLGKNFEIVLPSKAFGCVMFLMQRSFKDRKSTRLNSSHANISYAVFCLKKIKS